MLILKMTYENMKHLYSFYRETGHRNTFIKVCSELGYPLTEDELCLIWQAFDVGYEEADLEIRGEYKNDQI